VIGVESPPKPHHFGCIDILGAAIGNLEDRLPHGALSEHPTAPAFSVRQVPETPDKGELASREELGILAQHVRQQSAAGPSCAPYVEDAHRLLRLHGQFPTLVHRERA
jgi:hypothetical protein